MHYRLRRLRRVKMILPALTEAKSPFWRPIKYSLFPPLGLATLAAYLSPDDEVDLQDQHVETLNVEDDPDLGRQLSDALSQAGYAVDLAPDGEEGHFVVEFQLVGNLGDAGLQHAVHVVVPPVDALLFEPLRRDV